MCLHMGLYANDLDKIDQPETSSTLINSWRNDYDLHSCFEMLYRASGGESKYFTCVEIALSEQQLTAILTSFQQRMSIMLKQGDSVLFKDKLIADTMTEAIRLIRVEKKYIFYTSW